MTALTAKVWQALRTKPAKEKAEAEPVLSALTGALMHAIAAAVFAFSFARGESILAGFVGSFLGALLGSYAGRSRLRTPMLVAIGALTIIVAVALRTFCVDGDWVAPVVGPATALRAGDAMVFGLGGLGVSFALRGLSSRRRFWILAEVIVVSLAFAQLVIAHRFGAINRPFDIADPIMSAGGDPTMVFLSIGAVATVGIVLMMLREKNPFRAVLHLLVIAFLVGILLSTTGMLEPPPPPDANSGLGLRPEDKEGGKGEEQETPSGGGQGEGEGQGGGQGQEPKPDDDIEFKDNISSSSQQVPVAVVLFHDDYSPPTGMYYFRQGAFSQYNGRRLIGATRNDVDRDIVDNFPTQATPVKDPPLVNQNRTTIETTVALLTEHTRPFGLEAPVSLAPSKNPNPARFKQTYRVTSAVTTADYVSMVGAELGAEDWDRSAFEHYTRAPEDPRYQAFVDKILKDLPSEDHVMKVAAITSYLGKKGKYSLKSRHADEEDPAGHFLFGDLTGYCVHFAHAATYLFRTAGIPARVATGYAVAESDRQGGSALVVSGGTAHAWPEVYLRGFGWVVADVSPETVLDPPPPPPDADLQRLLGELARGEAPTPPDPDSTVPEIKEKMMAFGRALARNSGWIILALLLLLYGAKVWRRLAPRFAGPSAMARVAYRADLDRLSELSVRRQRGESREAFANRIRSEVPAFDRLTQAHVGPVFGSKRNSDVSELSKQVQTQIQSHFPLARRVLGWIIPWSFLSSR